MAIGVKASCNKFDTFDVFGIYCSEYLNYLLSYVNVTLWISMTNILHSQTILHLSPLLITIGTFLVEIIFEIIQYIQHINRVVNGIGANLLLHRFYYLVCVLCILNYAYFNVKCYGVRWSVCCVGRTMPGGAGRSSDNRKRNSYGV